MRRIKQHPALSPSIKQYHAFLDTIPNALLIEFLGLPVLAMQHCDCPDHVRLFLRGVSHSGLLYMLTSNYPDFDADGVEYGYGEYQQLHLLKTFVKEYKNV